MNIFLFSLLLFFVLLPETQQEGLELFSKEIKCLICQVTVHEMNKAIAKTDPTRMIDMPGYGLDKEARKVPLIKSEMFLTELMEDVCKKTDNYARAWYKDSMKLTLLKLLDADNDDQMNADVSEVEFVQDGDLNKSLPHFCMEVLEDNEQAFLDHYMGGNNPLPADQWICHKRAQYCNADLNGIYGNTEATIILNLK